jgi:hypothetical protein
METAIEFLIGDLFEKGLLKLNGDTLKSVGIAKEMFEKQQGYNEEEMLKFAWYLVINIGQYSCDKIAHFEGKYLEQFKQQEQ